MGFSLYTVRAKLAFLVATPLLLLSVVVPVFFAIAHRQLMANADDQVEGAERAFQVELDDDLADLTMAVRVISSNLQTRDALAAGDAVRVLEVAHTFEQLYPRIDILIATAQGHVLADVGPTQAAVALNDIPQLRSLPQTGEFHAILPNGCSVPSIHAPPARVVAGSVGKLGWVVACDPLDEDYLKNTASKLSLELALLDGADGKQFSGATPGFPLPLVSKAVADTTIERLNGRTWAVQRFKPLLSRGTAGGEVVIVAASDLTKFASVAFRNAAMIVGAIIVVGIGAIAVGRRISRRMGTSLAHVIAAFKKLAAQQYVHVPVTGTHDELEWLENGFNQMVDGLVERDKLRTTFGKYMTESVLTHLLSGKIALGGETLTVTILFSDIRSFTSISEKMDAQALVGLLNEYFTEMVGIVMKNGGVVDKYIGDAIMVVFGAPVPGENDAVNAVRAAVQMHEALRRLNSNLRTRGITELQTGIGIHTGEVVAGNIGSEQRMEYTVIGDAVNVASRLESATKDLGTPIVMSQATYEMTKDVADCEQVGEISVKGRAQPVQVWAIRGVIDKAQVT